MMVQRRAKRWVTDCRTRAARPRRPFQPPGNHSLGRLFPWNCLFFFNWSFVLVRVTVYIWWLYKTCPILQVGNISVIRGAGGCKCSFHEAAQEIWRSGFLPMLASACKSQKAFCWGLFLALQNYFSPFLVSAFYCHHSILTVYMEKKNAFVRCWLPSFWIFLSVQGLVFLWVSLHESQVTEWSGGPLDNQ